MGLHAPAPMIGAGLRVASTPTRQRQARLGHACLQNRRVRASRSTPNHPLPTPAHAGATLPRQGGGSAHEGLQALDKYSYFVLVWFCPVHEGRAHEASWRGAGPVPAPAASRGRPVRAASRHGRAAPLRVLDRLPGATGEGGPQEGSTSRDPIPRQLGAERAWAHPDPGGSGREWGRWSDKLCRTPAGRQGAGILNYPLSWRPGVPLPHLSCSSARATRCPPEKPLNRANANACPKPRNRRLHAEIDARWLRAHSLSPPDLGCSRGPQPGTQVGNTRLAPGEGWGEGPVGEASGLRWHDDRSLSSDVSRSSDPPLTLTLCPQAGRGDPRGAALIPGEILPPWSGPDSR